MSSLASKGLLVGGDKEKEKGNRRLEKGRDKEGAGIGLTKRKRGGISEEEEQGEGKNGNGGGEERRSKGGRGRGTETKEEEDDSDLLLKGRNATAVKRRKVKDEDESSEVNYDMNEPGRRNGSVECEEENKNNRLEHISVVEILSSSEDVEVGGGFGEVGPAKSKKVQRFRTRDFRSMLKRKEREGKGGIKGATKEHSKVVEKEGGRDGERISGMVAQGFYMNNTVLDLRRRGDFDKIKTDFVSMFKSAYFRNFPSRVAIPAEYNVEGLLFFFLVVIKPSTSSPFTFCCYRADEFCLCDDAGEGGF
jgi:hypothetical protein